MRVVPVYKRGHARSSSLRKTSDSRIVANPSGLGPENREFESHLSDLEIDPNKTLTEISYCMGLTLGF